MALFKLPVKLLNYVGIIEELADLDGEKVNKGERFIVKEPSAGGYADYIIISTGYASNTAWAATTVYTEGDIVNQNSKVLKCVNAGTSDTTLDVSSNSAGNLVTDGTVTWYVIGDLATVKGANIIQS